MQTYCQSCGAQITYKPSEKPAFCSSCGASTDKKKTKKAEKKMWAEEELEELEYNGEDDDLYVPDNISQLDVVIEGDWKQRGETLGSIVPPPEPENE
jgi:ribosomal protein L37E